MQLQSVPSTFFKPVFPLFHKAQNNFFLTIKMLSLRYLVLPFLLQLRHGLSPPCSLDSCLGVSSCSLDTSSSTRWAHKRTVSLKCCVLVSVSSPVYFFVFLKCRSCQTQNTDCLKSFCRDKIRLIWQHRQSCCCVTLGLWRAGRNNVADHLQAAATGLRLSCGLCCRCPTARSDSP